MNRIKQPLQAKGMSPTEPARRPAQRLNTVNLYAANRLPPPAAVPHRIADICERVNREDQEKQKRLTWLRYTTT